MCSICKEKEEIRLNKKKNKNKKTMDSLGNDAYYRSNIPNEVNTCFRRLENGD